jgi:hypothetical protein
MVINQIDNLFCAELAIAKLNAAFISASECGLELNNLIR